MNVVDDIIDLEHQKHAKNHEKKVVIAAKIRKEEKEGYFFNPVEFCIPVVGFKKSSLHDVRYCY